MYYDASQRAPLTHNPLKAIVAPRPIAWVSSVASNGEVNLAPFSFFNIIADRPGIVVFSCDGIKDTIANISETREFTVNVASWEFREEMLVTSEHLPRGVNEFDHAGLEMEPSGGVRPPRVKGIPAALECRLLDLRELTDLAGAPTNRHMVLGQVVGVYIDDRYIREGRVDARAMQLIARCGYFDYTVADSFFEMRAKDHPGLVGADGTRS